MQEKYLVINAGSSSLKFSLYEMPNKKLIIKGNVEKIGENVSAWTISKDGEKQKYEGKVKNHIDAVKIMINCLLQYNAICDISEICGVGHRILHGGEYYNNSILIDDSVINNIKSLTKFGPLHHPGEIAGIEALKDVLGDIPMTATFDTAFHQTIPQENYMYAVPYEWYTKYGVRKYGFHGTSHKYITEYMKKKLNKDDVNIISCHVGNGASICAIKDGKSYDTSMGLTPLDGLMMGTRCGSIDPSIIEYLLAFYDLDIEDINKILNNNSGMKGITGTNDLRDVRTLANKGDKNSLLALTMYANSIVKYISNYYVELEGKVDSIVFTAGVLENECIMRKTIMDKLKCLGILIDENINEQVASFKNIQEAKISSSSSSIDVYVIPTDEEIMILNDLYQIVKDNTKQKRLIKNG